MTRKADNPALHRGGRILRAARPSAKGRAIDRQPRAWTRTCPVEASSPRTTAAGAAICTSAGLISPQGSDSEACHAVDDFRLSADRGPTLPRRQRQQGFREPLPRPLHGALVERLQVEEQVEAGRVLADDLRTLGEIP